jgi:imidazolonepropionase-like amidohydrolase
MAHASSDEAVAMAVRAGVASIEHGYFLSRDTLKLMAEKGVAWVPTVIPVAAQLAARSPDPGISCIDQQDNRGVAQTGFINQPAFNQHSHHKNNYVIAKTVDRQLAMINEAHALGVTLGVGTDAGAAGVRHGYSYWQELALYRQAGLTPGEIIRCATINSARILGLDWGHLAPRRPAAMIAVSGDPLADIDCLKDIRYVFLPMD